MTHLSCIGPAGLTMDIDIMNNSYCSHVGLEWGRFGLLLIGALMHMQQIDARLCTLLLCVCHYRCVCVYACVRVEEQVCVCVCVCVCV